MEKNITIVVEDFENMRLDRFVRHQFAHVTQGVIQKALRQGHIRVNEKKCEANYRLQNFDVVTLSPKIVEEKNDKPIAKKEKPKLSVSPHLLNEFKQSIIFEDKDILIVNKIAGLAVQGGSKTDMHIDTILEHFADEKNGKPRLVHRLDKDTSGVLVLAKTRKMAEYLTKQFETKQVEKTYWAIVVGVPKIKQGKITYPIRKLPGKLGEKMVVDEKEGLKATTLYKVVESFGQKASWLELFPLTGRTHQIRVHCSAMGHPIVGDGKYGGAESHLFSDRDSMHLHARHISFKMPSGKDVSFTADLPPHMKKTWSFFEL